MAKVFPQKFGKNSVNFCKASSKLHYSAKVLQMFNAKMFNSQLTDLYYISLFSTRKPDRVRNTPPQTTPSSTGALAIASQGDKSVMILSTQGNAGEEGGVVTLLGVYVENGFHNEVKFIFFTDLITNCIKRKNFLSFLIWYR